MYAEVRRTTCNLHKEQIMRGVHCVSIQTLKQRFVSMSKAEWYRICKKTLNFSKSDKVEVQVRGLKELNKVYSLIAKQVLQLNIKLNV